MVLLPQSQISGKKSVLRVQEIGTPDWELIARAESRQVTNILLLTLDAPIANEMQ
jgi:hypothetical protein